MPGAVKIFIAYSRKDSEYLDEIRTHFTPLERSQKVTVWYDGKIEPGAVWEVEIKKRLHTAHIILLLVSADSIASDYFYDKEMKDALIRHKQGTAVVVPFIVRPCAWNATPLKDLQAIPLNGKAVTTWSNKDEAYNDAVDRLWAMINKIWARLQEKSETKDIIKDKPDPDEEWDLKKEVDSNMDIAGNQNSKEQLLPNENIVKLPVREKIRGERSDLSKSADNEKSRFQKFVDREFAGKDEGKWWVGIVVHLFLFGSGLYYINPNSKRRIVYPILIFCGYAVSIICLGGCEESVVYTCLLALLIGYLAGAIDVLIQSQSMKAKSNNR